MFSFFKDFFNKKYRSQRDAQSSSKTSKPHHYKKIIVNASADPNSASFRLSNAKFQVSKTSTPTVPDEPYSQVHRNNKTQNIKTRTHITSKIMVKNSSAPDLFERKHTLHPQGPRLPPSNVGFAKKFAANNVVSKNSRKQTFTTSTAISQQPSALQASKSQTKSIYQLQEASDSNSSIDSTGSFNQLDIKVSPSPTKLNNGITKYHHQTTFLNADDIEDPYNHQTYDKSASSEAITPHDIQITTASSSVSPTLNRTSTGDSYFLSATPISPDASSMSSGIHSRSTNTQYSTETSDSFEDDSSPLRHSNGSKFDSHEHRPYSLPADFSQTYNPYFDPPRSHSPPKDNNSNPYKHRTTLSNPIDKTSENDTSFEAPQKNFNPYDSSDLQRPKPPVRADSDSVTSSETLTSRVPRSQSTLLHESRFNLPSRSYTMGTRSFSGSGQASNSLRSSSFSTADDSLMLRLDLPMIPDSKVQFDASKLSSKDFEQCKSPWLISSLTEWISKFAVKRDMTFEELSEALIGLFRHTVPTLGWVAAERVTVPLLESLTNQGFLSVNNETGMVIVDGSVSPSGVLPTITSSGCYSTKAHTYEDTSYCAHYRCYSSRCWRSLPYKAVLPEVERVLELDDSDRLNWAKIWGLSDDEINKLDKKVVERQSAIHELIATEETYLRGLKVFLSVYGESLSRVRPAIVPQQSRFWNNTFGCIQGLIDCNGAQFLSHLKARQSQQGPYISGIADLIMNWLKIAKQPYLNRAKTYSFSYRVMAVEKVKNFQFQQWLEDVEHDPRVSRQQKFDFLMSSPFTRLCRYNLLFSRIKESTPVDNPDYALLDRCMEECKAIVSAYNKCHGEAEDLSSILTLDEKIIFNSEDAKVDLRLSEGRRKIIYEGDVLRKGEHGYDYVDTHMILLDHYLIMAKVRKDQTNKYLVSKKVGFY